ncbi:MAG: hypothetical protein WC740_06235 [Verrucomicrobiia bacterium]
MAVRKIEVRNAGLARKRERNPMNRHSLLIQVLGLSLAVVASGYSTARAQANPEQAKAVAAIQEFGGTVTFDTKSPDKTVIGVTLRKSKALNAGLTHVRSLASLQSLDLRESMVNDAGLENLTGLAKLRSLILDKTQVSDAGLEKLKTLTNLELLYLEAADITDTGVERLRAFFPNLHSLILCYTKITDAGLAHLKGLRLTYLAMEGTQVTDAGLEHLKGLTDLTKLDLIGVRAVTDAGLEHLKGLANLQTLYLRGTKVTEAGVEHLKALPNLRMLDIGLRDATAMEKIRQALPKCKVR